ncbi:MAG TPA: helix-turn-helix transcriptional regulator [Allosphingosinicella sp.]|jgi:transcriptional regulator
MVTNIPAGAEEWTPQWSGEDLEQFERLRAQLAPQISLVRRLRTALGLSQLEVAEALGTTQPNVSKIEKRGDPTLSVLARLVKARRAKLRLTIETEQGEEFTIAIAS